MYPYYSVLFIRQLHFIDVCFSDDLSATQVVRVS